MPCDITRDISQQAIVESSSMTCQRTCSCKPGPEETLRVPFVGQSNIAKIGERRGKGGTQLFVDGGNSLLRCLTKNTTVSAKSFVRSCPWLLLCGFTMSWLPKALAAPHSL
eukprot:scaffold3678_cov143-Skeletonema_menzelii.AAC.8